jgi:transposase-like protein
MPRFDPTEFGRLPARLTPQELRRAESLIADARKRAEAVLEIDARADAGGPASPCPRFGGGARARWGRTRTRAQRWRCSECGATWSSRSGTPLARVHRPDLVIALARDRIEAPPPMSCRRGAEVLGVSRHGVWRWRMKIINALPPKAGNSLAGIVEGCHRSVTGSIDDGNEAHQRDSRTRSKEWARHQHDPTNHPAPPRCPIPDDHISPRRSALFMARSVLRDIREGVWAC